MYSFYEPFSTNDSSTDNESDDSISSNERKWGKKKKYKDEITGDFQKIKPPIFDGETNKG